MSVNKVDRRESKIEFDNTYFKVYDDAIRLIRNHFGADKKRRIEYKGYIKVMATKILDLVMEMGTHIRIANSIYPKYPRELETRRLEQDKAIGLCFDLLTKYQIIMRELHVKDDKYVQEIKNVVHEINCLKKWRASDKRFIDQVKLYTASNACNANNNGNANNNSPVNTNRAAGIIDSVTPSEDGKDTEIL